MKIEIITNEKLAESVYIYKHQSGLEVRVLPKEGYDSVYAVFGTKYGSVDVTFSRDGNGAVTVTDGSFTMPASTVYVSVAYAPVEMSWTVNGESFTGDYGTWHEIRVTIKPGEVLAQAPADCTLVSATQNKSGSQTLVYVFQLLREGRSYSWSVVGNPETIFYIFNGALYDPATAPVSGTENVDFDHWAEGFAGINFATFTTTRTTSYVWLWAMILVLSVIYLIVLIYKLYMNELLGPSIVTRIATAIVSAFFAAASTANQTEYHNQS